MISMVSADRYTREENEIEGEKMQEVVVFRIELGSGVCYC